MYGSQFLPLAHSRSSRRHKYAGEGRSCTAVLLALVPKFVLPWPSAPSLPRLPALHTPTGGSQNGRRGKICVRRGRASIIATRVAHTQWRRALVGSSYTSFPNCIAPLPSSQQNNTCLKSSQQGPSGRGRRLMRTRVMQHLHCIVVVVVQNRGARGGDRTH